MHYSGVNFNTLRQNMGFQNCYYLSSVAGQPKNGCRPIALMIKFLRVGLVNKRSEITPKHPLEQSELFYELNQHRIKLGMANSISGSALPLTIQAERSSAARVSLSLIVLFGWN